MTCMSSNKFKLKCLNLFEDIQKNKMRIDGDEKLKAFEIMGSLQWEKQKTSIRGNFSLINNDFT